MPEWMRNQLKILFLGNYYFGYFKLLNGFRLQSLYYFQKHKYFLSCMQKTEENPTVILNWSNYFQNPELKFQEGRLPNTVKNFGSKTAMNGKYRINE